MTALSLSLIINTYNQPDYLGRVLQAISAQTFLPNELLLADDGSKEETRQVFMPWAAHQPFRCEHVWQPHEGFRRARILNQAIAIARSDYLVFLDGDTVPHPKFLSDHLLLSRSGAFVQGHRALVGEGAAPWFGKGNFWKDRRRALWKWQLRGLKHCFRWPGAMQKVRRDLRGVRGCNLATWRADLVKVNGYNEEFVGWGREDSELAVRLMNSGVQRVDVRGWAVCYHLWHPPVTRAELPRNDELLEKARQSGARTCEVGLSQHIQPPAAPQKS